MTPRKPKEVTAPALPADEAFGNLITAERDAAVLAEQALRQDYASQKAYFDREQQRLDDRRRKTLGALAEQISRQQRKIAGADASLEAMQARAAQ